ncbi:hypothetical protein WS75_09275 [Burkholderia sp. FL-7-2-10-S1-D7]|nr:hypothetical protein WS75_09275 [Burkholderia sp. FL-7-2-10-S1-D7]
MRPSRALPYELHASAQVDAGKGTVTLKFANTGLTAAVFHVYDKLHLDRVPRRYVVEPGKVLRGDWAALTDDGGGTVKSNKVYGQLSGYCANHDRGHGNDTGTTWTVAVHAGGQSALHWKLDSTGHGYDFAVTADSDARFPRRMAGRVETGRHSVSDPAMRFAARFRRHQRPPGPSTGRAPGAARSDPAETPARRGSNIRRIGGAALISCPRKCSVLRPVRVKLRQAAFNNDIFANLAHTTRG